MISDSITAQRKLDELREKMALAYCPIIKGDCSNKCIHYSAGHVFDFLDVINIVGPRCKLWK